MLRIETCQTWDPENLIQCELDIKRMHAEDLAANMIANKADSWTGSFEMDDDDKIAMANLLRQYGPACVRRILNRSIGLCQKAEAADGLKILLDAIPA